MGEDHIIAYEDDDILVLFKESGLPTVPLKGREDEMTLLKKAGDIDRRTLGFYGRNEWEGGALHRLDNLTSGLVIFCKNQDSYDFLSSEQEEGDIWKVYYAKTEDERLPLDGFPSFPFDDVMSSSGVISSYFRPFGKGRKSVRPSVVPYESDRIYHTEVVQEKTNVYRCTISLGFRHQIRAHLAWGGHPVYGDTLYGGVERGEFGLVNWEISFRRPSDRALIGVRASREAPFM